jgi:hypothetical protein
MLYQITEIEFDFTDDLDDEALDVESQDEIYEEVMSSFWEAEDGDDLVDKITCWTGWCINSLSYSKVSK